MSLCDPYTELLLYLEQTNDEIARAFEDKVGLGSASAEFDPSERRNFDGVSSDGSLRGETLEDAPSVLQKTLRSNVIDIITEFQKLTNAQPCTIDLFPLHLPGVGFERNQKALEDVLRLDAEVTKKNEASGTTRTLQEVDYECDVSFGDNIHPGNVHHEMRGLKEALEADKEEFKMQGVIPKSIYLTNVRQESHMLYPEEITYPEEVTYDLSLIRQLSGSMATIHSDGDYNPSHAIATATQTSSMSQSSTNLTWSSDCSSSPCLTSDPDVAVPDSNRSSSSSAEGAAKASQWLVADWQQEFCGKSSSAPVLKKLDPKVAKQTRSQSDRHLASEIEAAEACKWLKAAGFPQYAQMYEDLQFPINLYAAAHDHPLLEQAVLQSVFRRLHVLNRCARVHQRIPHIEDSEDEQFALSDNWTYQSDIRRWSRTAEDGDPSSRWSNSLPRSKLDVQTNRESWREKCRRTESSKQRRRHDSFGGCETSFNVLEALAKQLGSLKGASEDASASKRPSKYIRRRKTRSLDKSDGWSVPSTPEKCFWHHIPKLTDSEKIGVGLNLDNARPISDLSCVQLQVLRKLALLKVTAYMEKYCPTHRVGWNWDLSRFIKKMKTPVYRDNTIFGVPLYLIFQRTGQNLPANIEEALVWLRLNGLDQVGLFRKPGVRSRIQALKAHVDRFDVVPPVDDQQAFDVADMVKLYFRELPEALMTIKLSETFINIFLYVPPPLRIEALLCALLLLPDEHREVLQILMNFLKSVAQNSEVNQMTEANLAMCFAPSLFSFNNLGVGRNIGSPRPKELSANKAAHECLQHILKHNNILFSIPQDLFNQCTASEINDYKAVNLCELGMDSNKNWEAYLEDCQTALLKEAREKSRGWVALPGQRPGVEVSYKKVADGHPLRLWKVTTEVEAPPRIVLHRLLRERHLWDADLLVTKLVAQVDNNVEVFQYVRRRIGPLPNEEYCVVRTWRCNLPRDACLIVETSVEHQEATAIPETVRGIILASRYLIEPCGSGKSRVVHLSRADMRGKMPNWYHKNYGHLMAIFLSKIQSSFRQVSSSGPESKV